MDSQHEQRNRTRSAEAEPSRAPEDDPKQAAGNGSDDAGEAADEDDSQAMPARAAIDVEEIADFGAALLDWESGLKSIKEGEVVQGRVLKVLEKEVIVDIGYKSEGVIDASEFRGLDGVIRVSPGDRIDVLLEKAEDGDGYVVLSKEKAERP